MHRRIVSLVLVMLLAGLIPSAARAQTSGWSSSPLAELPPAPWRNPGAAFPGAPAGPDEDPQFIELRPVADTFVASGGGVKDRNFGAEEALRFGTEEYLEHARTLLRFELPAAVPGAFAGASLFLPVAGSNAPLPLTATVHRLLWDWSESQTVWWSQPQAVYATTFEVPAEPAWVPVDVTQLYLDWKVRNYANHGIEIRGPESPARIAKGMFSREAGPDAPQPTLVIFYLPDRVPPSCSIANPASPAPSPLTVSFYCQDTGGSGMAGAEVQMREGQGPWRDAARVTGNTNVVRIDGLLGGRTYSFRVRGEDNAHNYSWWTGDGAAVTTIEGIPPQHFSGPAPAWVTADQMPYEVANVSQYSELPPQSEPIRIERRYADEADGVWRNLDDLYAPHWLSGHRYRFRTRAIDNASNATPWYSFGPISVYSHFIRGHVFGPDGQSLPGVPLSAAPAALNAPVTDEAGAYEVYYGGTEARTLSAAAPDFKLVGQTVFPGSKNVEGANVFLYPAANVLRNGDFAAPLENDWQVSGDVAREAPALGSVDLAVRIGSLPSQTFTDYDASKQPCIATGPDGTTHLAWVDYGGDWYAKGKLYCATLPKGGAAWSTPQLVGETQMHAYTYGIRACQMAVDAGGRVYLLSSPPSGPVPYDLRTRAAGGNWERVAAPQYPYIYAIAAREPDMLHVVYSSDCSGPDCATLGNPNIYYATWRVGQNWSEPRPVGRSESYTEYDRGVDLLLTADGARHVVWEWQPDRYSSNPSATVRYATSLDGLAWSWPQDMSPAHDVYGAILRADNAGQLYAFWNAYDNNRNLWEVLYARRTGNAWSAPRVLGRPVFAPPVHAAPGDRAGYTHDMIMAPNGQWWYMGMIPEGFVVYTGSSLDALTERYRLEYSQDYALLAAAPHAMLVLDRPRSSASRNSWMRITQLPYTTGAAPARISQTVRVPDGPTIPYLYAAARLERSNGQQTDAELNVYIRPSGGEQVRLGNVPSVAPAGMNPYFWSLESWRGKEIEVALEFDPRGDQDALAWLDNIYVTHQPLNLRLSMQAPTVRPASGTDMTLRVTFDNVLDVPAGVPIELTWPAGWTLRHSTLAPTSNEAGRAVFLINAEGASTHAFDITLSIPAASGSAAESVEARLGGEVASRDYTPGDNTAALRLIVDGRPTWLPVLHR